MLLYGAAFGTSNFPRALSLSKKKEGRKKRRKEGRNGMEWARTLDVLFFQVLGFFLFHHFWSYTSMRSTLCLCLINEPFVRKTADRARSTDNLSPQALHDPPVVSLNVRKLILDFQRVSTPKTVELHTIYGSV